MTEEPPTPTEKPTSGPAMTFKVLSTLVLLLLGTCSVFLDAHKVAWYAVFPYTYYMEIKTDLTVDGEPVQLSGVAACKWDQRLTPLLSTIRGSGWDPQGSILAKQLPSGEAVIAFVHLRCGVRGDPSGFGGAKKGFWKTAHSLFAYFGHLPIQTLLLDDANTPTRIEWSYSKAYFEDPRARVRYIGGTYLPKRWARRPDPRDEVPWLRVERGPSKLLAGFIARVTPREVWSTEAEAAAALEPLTEVTNLTREHHFPSSAFDRSDNTVRPLFLKDGYWDFRPDGSEPDGIVMLYPRKDPITGEFIPLNRWDNMFVSQGRLSVNGRPTNVRGLHFTRIYEPVSGDLLFLAKNAVSILEDKVWFRGGSHKLSGPLFKF